MVSVAKWKEAEQFQNPQVPFLSSARTSRQLAAARRLGVLGARAPPKPRIPSPLLSAYFIAGELARIRKTQRLGAVCFLGPPPEEPAASFKHLSCPGSAEMHRMGLACLGGLSCLWVSFLCQKPPAELAGPWVASGAVPETRGRAPGGAGAASTQSERAGSSHCCCKPPGHR